MRQEDYACGFSLVELSIVLVILGLLTGGILAGQSLIRASELRAVSTEYGRYQTAVQTFRDKYFALPGDFRKATDFWTIAAGSTGNDATCKDTVQTSGTATCNGDGDGVIGTDGYNNGYEIYLFWKHLQNAGLIEGNLSGTTASAGGQTSPYLIMTSTMPGWNIPYSKLGGGVWYVANLGSANVSIQKFYGSYVASALPYYPNSLYLLDRGKSPLSGGSSGPLAPEEIWNIDTKMDDGRPGSGKIETFHGSSGTNAGNCLTNADPTVAQYLLTSNSKDCVAVFVRAF